jgi:hypothetical protein
MKVSVASSSKQTVSEATNELQSRLDVKNARLILYFASSAYNPEELSLSMKEAFPGISIFGCSTAGEIVSGAMLNNSVVAMALSKELIHDHKGVVIKHISKENHVREAFQVFETHFKKSMFELDYKKYVGLIMIDGLSGAEEKIMETVGDLTNIFFVGGSAADDLKLKTTYVYQDGQAYTDAALLVLLELADGSTYDLIKTESFRVTDKLLVATQTNPQEREVLTFNNIPAAQAYAEALGISIEETPNYFFDHPVGLIIDDEPYVRGIQQLKGSGMKFYCNLIEGMELKLLEASETIIDDTKQAIEKAADNLGGISGIINFNCCFRAVQLQKFGLTEAYGALFKDIPTIGFNTYGEEYLGHINQTATMIAFK